MQVHTICNIVNNFQLTVHTILQEPGEQSVSWHNILELGGVHMQPTIIKWIAMD